MTDISWMEAEAYNMADPYRCCNSCGSNDGVIEITVGMCVGNTKQETQVVLCKSCAQKLRFALNSRYGRYSEHNE